MTTILAVEQQGLIFAVLLAFNILAFVEGDKRNMIFWVFAAVANIIIGLHFASGTAEYSSQWTLGFLIGLLGLYGLTHFAMWAIGNYRKKNNTRKDRKEE